MYLKELILCGALFTGMSACSKDNVTPVNPPAPEETSRIFPKPLSGWVGDVMPYYLNGQFEIFFLHDATDLDKQSSRGEHAVHKFTATDLTSFDYEGEMIPYGHRGTQDHLIGTGAMVQVEGVYFYYYTGHNGTSSWLQNNNPGWVPNNNREAVMLATSTDLNNWTKQEDFLIKAPDGYSGFDFRDPYVFYNEEFGEYWMLVSTQASGRGVLLVYTSANPATHQWEMRGPLDVEGDYLMLECADIFQSGNRYYLLFAEDWSSTPGTRYRVANSTAGPWLKPQSGRDMFDGHQFYAAKTAANGEGRYAFAWAHRRRPENDNGQRTWAGNLVTHEIFSTVEGELRVKSPAAVKALFNSDVALSLAHQDGSVSASGSNIVLNGTSSKALAVFQTVAGTQRVEASLQLDNTAGIFSFLLNADDAGNENYTIEFKPGGNRIVAFNNGQEVTRVPFAFAAGETYAISLMIEGSVCVLYVNDQVALTNRVYGMQQRHWGISAEGLTANVTDIAIRKTN